MARSSYDMGERSLSELLSDASDKLQALLRREIELAKIELQDQVQRGGKGVALLAGTAVAAFLAAVMVSFAAAWGLAEVMPTGFAFLIVGVVYGVVAAILGSKGRQKLSEVRPVPQQTMQTIKEDVQVAKESISAGMSDEPSGGSYQWRPGSR